MCELWEQTGAATGCGGERHANAATVAATFACHAAAARASVAALLRRLVAVGRLEGGDAHAEVRIVGVRQRNAQEDVTQHGAPSARLDAEANADYGRRVDG